MANTLFNTLNGNVVGQNNDFVKFINEVKRMQQTFNGNPKEEVQKLLNTGRLSQAQFNQYAQMANQIMAIMPK